MYVIIIKQNAKTNIGKNIPNALFLPFFTSNSLKLSLDSIFLISFLAYFIYILLNKKLNNIQSTKFTKKAKKGLEYKNTDTNAVHAIENKYIFLNPI